MDATWDVVLKLAAIVVPVFTGLTLFGVGYLLSQVGGAKREVARVREDLRGLTDAITVRIETARRDHEIIDRRLDEHDDMFERHGHRIAALEGRRLG